MMESAQTKQWNTMEKIKSTRNKNKLSNDNERKNTKK